MFLSESGIACSSLNTTRGILMRTKRTVVYFTPLCYLAVSKYSSSNIFTLNSVPTGASNLKYNRKLYGAEKLCRLCSGKGEDKCARNSREPYYGYEGAFQCLKDGVGDVAFIKQSILTALSPQDQAKYKLLCPGDTIAGW